MAFYCYYNYYLNEGCFIKNLYLGNQYLYLKCDDIGYNHRDCIKWLYIGGIILYRKIFILFHF